MTRQQYTTDELNLSAAALARSQDELLLDFGRALAGPGASRDGDAEDVRGRADNWFERNRDELRKRVCGQDGGESLSDGIVDVAAVADMIADLTGQLVAYTVAAIILKRGLKRLCT